MKRTDVRDPLALLARSDKWYLGGANRLLWAPEFPLHLDKPGFWDRALYYNIELQPLFTWTLLDEKDRQVPLEFVKRQWRPDVLTQHFRAANGIRIVERKCILPNDVAICSIRVENRGSRARRFSLVAWTAQEHAPTKQFRWLSDIAVESRTVGFVKHLRQPNRPEFAVACLLGLSKTVRSACVSMSEGTALSPRWELSPFFESVRSGKLPLSRDIAGVNPDGIAFAGCSTRLPVPPHGLESVTIAMAVAGGLGEAAFSLAATLHQKDPLALSTKSWDDHFVSVPSFSCSDEHLTNYYWYRWYGLRLNTMYGNEGNYQRPFVCEGIGYFRAPISYSAQCHVLENRWMHDPDLARGSLLTFIDNQRDDGGFRGYIDVSHHRQEMFYHANWGRVLRALDIVHPSAEYLRSVYDGLKKYVSYFDTERDEEVSGLYDIDNHYETGQEFMHRYTAVDPRADEDNWGEVFRLKGVDVTVYIYELKRALATIATQLGNDADADLWTMEAERIREAVRTKMWDPGAEMFFDIDPKTGVRTGVKAATCFYPYMTDIVEKFHLRGLDRHLFNTKEFWTSIPAPSTSADDPTFSALPVWKRQRMNCPWNGRVWPMTNSHLIESVATCAIRFDSPRLRKRTVEFLTKFVRMMCFDGDPKRPNCFEHYNPRTGQPSLYRGIDDYQHSWIIDLIIQYICGIRPEDLSVTIDPFPFGLRHAVIDRVHIRGHVLRVEIAGPSFTVILDGSHKLTGTIGVPISLQI